MDSTHETTAELFTSRPAPEERLEKELLCYDLLEKYKIPYTGLDHPAAMSVEDCHNADVLLGIHICKNLFLCNRQKTDFYLLMILGDKKFKTKDITKQIGSARLSFGGPAEMEQYLDITPGSVSVLGLMNDTENHVRLLVDEDLLKGEYFGCHPCVNTSSLRVKTRDILGPFLKAVHHDMTVVKLPGENEEA